MWHEVEYVLKFSPLERHHTCTPVQRNLVFSSQTLCFSAAILLPFPNNLFTDAHTHTTSSQAKLALPKVCVPLLACLSFGALFVCNCCSVLSLVRRVFAAAFLLGFVRLHYRCELEHRSGSSPWLSHFNLFRLLAVSTDRLCLSPLSFLVALYSAKYTGGEVLFWQSFPSSPPFRHSWYNRTATNTRLLAAHCSARIRLGSTSSAFGKCISNAKVNIVNTSRRIPSYTECEQFRPGAVAKCKFTRANLISEIDAISL